MAMIKTQRDEAMTALAERVIPIQQDPEKLGGEPTIGAYRLPVETLLDYLIDGYSIDEFIEIFEGTPREAVVAVLELIKQAVCDGALTGIVLEADE